MFAGRLLASRLLSRQATRNITLKDTPNTTLLALRENFSTSSYLRLHDDNSVLNQQRQELQQDSTSSPQGDTKISVTFTRPDGTKVTVKSSQDKTLYDAVIDNNVDIDGFGACEGTLCCTTCHLIFKEADFEKVGPPSDEELDMLDLAYGLTDTSRLGCQVSLKKEYDPLEVQVPASINDDSGQALANFLEIEGRAMIDDPANKFTNVSSLVAKLLELWKELPETERKRYEDSYKRVDAGGDLSDPH